jgi:hypothetical protein
MEQGSAQIAGKGQLRPAGAEKRKDDSNTAVPSVGLGGLLHRRAAPPGHATLKEEKNNEKENAAAAMQSSCVAPIWHDTRVHKLFQKSKI